MAKTLSDIRRTQVPTQAVYKKTTVDADKFIDKKRVNTKSDLIEITHDKLENILLKDLKYMTVRTSWISPISLFVTILLAMLTADFKSFIGISKDVWCAIFLLGLIVSFIWLIYSIVMMIHDWKKADIEYVINKIKNIEE